MRVTRPEGTRHERALSLIRKADPKSSAISAKFARSVARDVAHAILALRRDRGHFDWSKQDGTGLQMETAPVIVGLAHGPYGPFIPNA